MSETIIAPAKRWAELHLEVGDYVKGDVQKPIYMASTEQIEFLLIKFAQAHVKMALEQASEYGNLVENSFGPEDILNCYPLENVK